MNLIFVTEAYPFGKGETFIENEIGYLAEFFEHIYLYVCSPSDNSCRELPNNVTVIPPNATVKRTYIIKAVKDIRFWKEAIGRIKSRDLVHNCSSVLYFSKNSIRASKQIKLLLKHLQDKKKQSFVIYSYWLSYIGMTALNIQKALKGIGITARVYTRCHGYDLYEERAYRNYLPFQEYMLSNFDRVFPCSVQGEMYLKKKYPQFREKIECSYLGIVDYFNGRWQNREPFTIVSCSNLIPLKRVGEIAKALKEITNHEIIWTHFGDGEQLNSLKKYVSEYFPSNIKVSFPGRVPNTTIFKYYQENNVSLFLNVSSSEGLPVSIMEACSFGIPVIATDVGGTSEIVKDGENGILLKKDFTREDLKKGIDKFIRMRTDEYMQFCKSSREQYQKRFMASKNYAMFCRKLTCS